MPDPLTIQVSPTPNPNALKFATNRVLVEGRAQTFSSPDQALLSPLAQGVLAVPGVASVFLMRDFLTVTREDGAAWEPIAEAVEGVLRETIR